MVCQPAAWVRGFELGDFVALAREVRMVMDRMKVNKRYSSVKIQYRSQESVRRGCEDVEGEKVQGWLRVVGIATKGGVDRGFRANKASSRCLAVGGARFGRSALSNFNSWHTLQSVRGPSTCQGESLCLVRLNVECAQRR